MVYGIIGSNTIVYEYVTKKSKPAIQIKFIFIAFFLYEIVIELKMTIIYNW